MRNPLKGLDLFETFNIALYAVMAIMMIAVFTVDLEPIVGWIVK